MTKIQLIVEGGKATTTPQLAQTLGPMKIPLNEVIGKVNEKTAAFQGIKVPVEVNVNDKDKTYTVTVGSPPTSELIKKELKLEKGSGAPNKEKIANVGAEQVIKIAKQKRDGLFDKTLKAAVKTVAGSCNSMGILIEGKTSDAFTKEVDAGAYDNEIAEERIEVSAEKKTRLQEQLGAVQETLRKEQERLKAAEEAEKAAVVEAPAAEAAPAEGAKKAEAGAEKKAAEASKTSAGAEKKAAAPEKKK
jgi:large subunit ribosomal protein L11